MGFLKAKMATVLIIDDEQEICDLLEDLFREEKGFAVLKADNGLDGVKLVKAHKPDVILLDIKLYGVMDGAQALKEIKKHDPRGKVIIITGFSDDAVERQIREIGIDAYLEKPFTPSQVISAVKEVLQKKWSEERG